MTDNKDVICAIVNAGRATAAASERTFTATAVYDGLEVSVPYAFDANGMPKALEEACRAARDRAAYEAPRRAASMEFGDMASLLAWTDRYKTEDTQAYVTPSQISVVVNDLPKGDGGARRDIRCALKLSTSDELSAWEDASEVWMDAEKFAAFIDEHSDELVSSDVFTMVNNLEVSSESVWKRTVEASGIVRLVDEQKSGPKTTVPRKFGFRVPVLSTDDEADLHDFTATLRLKLDGKKPTFQFEIVGLQRTISKALLNIVATLGKHCPTYLGV